MSSNIFQKLANEAFNYLEAPFTLARAFNPHAGRALQSGEIKLLQRFFKDSIDYDKIRICKGGAGSSLGANFRNHIFFPADVYEDDFSKPSTNSIFEKLGALKLLMHEATHVWQHQNAKRFWQGLKEGAKNSFGVSTYEYDMDEDKPFEQYGTEQQAMIVEHLFKADFLASAGRSNGTRFEINGERAEDVAATLQKKVGQIFERHHLAPR